jgi:hypothetical protein
VALGHYEILYKDREKCIAVKNMGGFLLVVSHSLRQEEYVIDFLGKTPEGKLWAMHFLLASSSRRVMGELVRLLRESSRVFAEAFVSHDRHTLFTLEESGPPRMTYTCESQ